MVNDTTHEDYKFEDIAPYPDSIFHEKMENLVREPGFIHAVKWVLPDINYDEFAQKLLQVNDKDTFQKKIMWPFLEMLADRTTEGITYDGIENLDSSKAYTFITNHRDIVLDTSFLNLCLLRAGLKTTQTAIGDNLLIYSWINDLVRMNNSFIVKRDLSRVKVLEAAQELSSYIHYSITDLKRSIWIAERQGRSKDSNDMAQESLIKMLGIAGGADFLTNVKEVNLLPVSISYEYDPNDYLKAREFLLRRNDPEFKKTQRDDLFAMETGLLQPKGRVHFQIGKPLNPEIAHIDSTLDRNTVAHDICHMVDCAIHSGYRIYPINYIAFDQLYKTEMFKDQYDAEEVNKFNTYVSEQLKKVDVPELTDDNMDFLHEMMLTMYANPLKNNLSADDTCTERIR